MNESKQSTLSVSPSSQHLPRDKEQSVSRPRPSFAALTSYSRRVAVAVAGAVLGIVLDRFTRGTAGISALSVLIVAASLIALFFAFEEQTRNMNGLRELTVSGATELRLQVAELKRNLSINVSFQAVSDLNTFSDISSDVVAQAMLGAKRELLIVDLLPASGDRPDASMRSDLLEAQWKAILRLPQDNPRLSYKRLCQVHTSGNSLIMPPLEPTFAAHCVGMLDLKQELGARVSLRLAPMRYPYKFIIVDGDTLIVELHRYERDGADPVVDKELVIRDAKGILIDVFKAMWDDLADRPETRTAVRTDLI